MVKITKGSKRTYILDTNVLIHDPMAVMKFDEHEVVIPLPVLEELDGMKQEQSDRGRQARQATRVLDDLMDSQGLEDQKGRPSIRLKPNGEAGGPAGALRFEKSEPNENLGLDQNVIDNKIISTAFKLHKENTSTDRTIVLVTNDTNMRIRAFAIGVPAEGYRNDEVFIDSDAMIDGIWRPAEDENFWELFEEAVPANLRKSESEGGMNEYRFVGGPVIEWYPGVMVLDGLGTFEGVVVDIDDDVATVRILQNFYNSNNVWGVNARDELQNFALNLMTDDSMDLITLAGPAGTGKTFLALACALHLVFQKKDYENIIITRETVAMGEEIGFLPGSEEEKMAPWMGAFLDNIEQLSGLGKGEKDQAGMDLIKNRLQMRSLGLMRGRSFSNSILIIDESQNLSPKQVKNLITRAGENTKIICLGNVAQIDTPYLSVGSTGLANLVQKFRQWPHAGHVTLRGVERSRLAAYAEEVL
jgi:PhoH-like ATPase